MLVKLYRDGPLRQRLAKGYTVAGRDRARALSALVAASRPLPDVLGSPPALRTSPDAPGALWIDTGAVWPYDPDSRARAARALAETVAAVARELAAFDCRLLPSGHRGADREDGGWLVPDLHAVEVLGDVQRELCTNLFREHSPVLLALAGRTAYGEAGGDGQGSRRLADTPDQLTTRYMHSCGAAHLAKITEELGRDGVARLESMDVNPLGDSALPMPNVALRLFDGQLSVATSMAHALLAQAVAVRARRMEREGRRVGSVRQPLVDRNRSRAVAQGLGAMFEAERRGGGKKAQATAGPGRAGQSGAAQQPPRPVPASDAALRLLDDLLPEFAALGATAEELAPLYTGLRLYRAHPSSVRNENDLVLRWQRGGAGPVSGSMAAACLRDPAWLLSDHLTAANREALPGGTAVVELALADRLAGLRAPAPPPAKEVRAPRNGQGRPRPPMSSPGRQRTADGRAAAGQTAGKAAARALVTALEAAGPGAPAGEQAIRQYLADGGLFDLATELRALDRERARPLRAALRPDRRAVTTLRVLPGPWTDGPLATVCARAHSRGTALLVVDLDVAEEPALRTWLRGPARSCGAGLRAVLLDRTRYRAQNGQRTKAEVLIVTAAAKESA